jgi:hypothetical protein
MRFVGVMQEELSEFSFVYWAHGPTLAITRSVRRAKGPTYEFNTS